MLNSTFNVEKKRNYFQLRLGIVFIINLIFLAIVFIYFSSLNNILNSESTLRFITLLGIIAFSWICISWYWLTNSIINVYSLFIFFSALFYLGQPIVITFGGIIENYNVYHTTVFSYEIINKAMIYVIKVNLLLHFGAILTCFKKRFIEHSTSNQIDYSNSMIIVGKVLFIISVFPTLIVLFNSVHAVSINGYIGLFTMPNTVASGGILVVISGFFVPAMYMLIIGNSENRIQRIFWIIVFMLYLIIIYTLGKRGTNTLQLIGLVLILHYTVKPIKMKHIFKIGIVGISFAFIMRLLTTIRAGLQDGNIKELIINEIQNNFIFSILAETGATLIVPSAVIAYSPNTIPFNYGETYLNFLWTLIPNWFWDVNPGLINGTLETTFTPLVSNQSVGGFGGSYLAELYYNFGSFALIVVPIIGYLLALLFFKTENASLNNNKLLLYSCIFASQIILWYVRSETLATGKSFIYYILVPSLLVVFVKDYLTRRKYNKERMCSLN